MYACNDMGKVAVVTDDHDEFGEEYQTIRVMSVTDAVKLRDQLTEVIEQVTAKPSNVEVRGCALLRSPSRLTGWGAHSFAKLFLKTL